MKEWNEPYNSFNSLKGLLYRDNFDGIMKGEFLPPIEVNIDPVNNCQLKCIWCNGKKIISKEPMIMTDEHLLELIDFCADWGVKAICFAGGGESVLHPSLDKALYRIKEKGMESAIITNGLFKDGEQIKAIAETCRWVGVSVDAVCQDTYKKVKGYDYFWKVIENIKKLVECGAREVTYKFLIHPINQSEISNACSMARNIGCHAFHARPCAFLCYDKIEREFDMDSINDQFGLCHFGEDEKFKVYTIFHKSTPKLARKIRFQKCHASPLLAMFEANGDVSICIDQKGYKHTRLCSHKDPETVRSIWGSEAHKALINEIDPSRCPKCTMGIYNELFEAYKGDRFCMNFP